MGKLPPPKDWYKNTVAKMRSGVSQYPALAEASMKIPGRAWMFPTAAGYSYDADGMDVQMLNGVFRWSIKHQALVLWNVARDAPVKIEGGWEYPNYYNEWVAALGPKSALQFIDETVQSKAAPMPVDPYVSQDALLRRGDNGKISFEVTMTVITVILKAVWSIYNIIKEQTNNGVSQKSPPLGLCSTHAQQFELFLFSFKFFVFFCRS